jgi:intermediate peptidase
VIDAAELCRSVHVDDGWRTNAQAAFDYLAQYIAQLNSDVHIYKALTQVTENASIFNLLTEEERRFATLLQAEFERDGIQLPDAQREQVVQLSHSTSQLEGLFSQNIVHSNQKFSVPSTPVKAVLPSTVLRAYGAQETDDNTIELHTNQAQLLQSLIRYSRDAELRRDVYMAHSTSVPENLAVLDALVQRRHELATALGFQSYAHRVLQDKMAQHPDRVFDFLYQLQNNTRPAWKRDMETIAQAKMAVEGTSQVEPWDISFYVGLLKARNGFDINVMSSYLTLDNCIRGMQQLVLNLFGMKRRLELILLIMMV